MRPYELLPMLFAFATGCLDLDALRSGVGKDMSMPNGSMDMAAVTTDMMGTTDLSVMGDMAAVPTRVFTLNGVTLNGISGNVAAMTSTVYVAGNSATVIKGGGTNFTKVTSPTGAANLTAVWVASASEAWVADDAGGGKIFQTTDSGMTFTDKVSVATKPLRAIYGRSTQDIMAAGDDTTQVEHWNGILWANLTDMLTNAKIHGIWASSTTYYIVGENGNSAKTSDFVTWNGISTNNSNNPFMRAVYGLSDTMIWSVGNTGSARVMQCNSGCTSWNTFVMINNNPMLNALWVNSPTEIWVVGGNATVQLCNSVSMRCADKSNSTVMGYTLTGVWGDGLGGLWIIGNNGGNGAIFKL